jgi:SAM-dependent methyltransferase
MQEIWDIPSLPFIFRPLGTPHNPDGVPDSMPFRLGVDPTTGRLVQLPTEQLDTVLDRAYSEGSMVTGLIDEAGIGLQYAEDFLDHLSRTLGTDRLDGQRVLEVGCGTGYLLSRLQQRGARVRGVDPGPQVEVGAARYGLSLDRGFFPAVDVGAGYDLVVLYCLLEHLPDPTALLRDVNGAVRPGGRVMVAVPDEQPYIAAGEISLLFHEHYSYFTARTLEATARAAGARDVKINRSTFSNLLFMDYLPDVPVERPADIAEDVRLAQDFRAKAEAMVREVSSRIDAVQSGGSSIGIFVPSRAANLLAIRDRAWEGVRFFDDNAALIGTFYPGLPPVIEGRTALLEGPPTQVLVMSLSFGDRIAGSLRPLLPPEIEIVLLSDLLAAAD